MGLSNALKHNKSITHLEVIEAKNITDENLTYQDIWVDFFKSLRYNKVLEEIIIEPKSSYSAQEILALQEGLKYNTSVKNFAFGASSSRGNFGQNVGPLGEALKCNKTLQKLYFEDLTISNMEDLEGLFAGLLANSSISYLRLDVVMACPLDPFVKYIQATRTLSTLVIDEQNLTTNNLQTICAALQSNKSLTTLRLTWKKDLRSIARFGELIKHNKAIKNLILDGKLDQSAAKDVEDALKVNKTISAIQFPRTKNCLNIGEILKHNTTLRDITIEDFGFSGEQLVQIIQEGIHLKRLYIRHVDVDNPDEVQQAMEDNCSIIACSDSLSPLRANCERNFDLQKQRYEDTAIIIHFIARSKIFEQLPVEVWSEIFKWIKYPGLESFDPLATSIFASYRNSRKKTRARTVSKTTTLKKNQRPTKKIRK